MKKNFLINLAFLLLLNLLVKPFWIFGIERSVQNVVGAQEYGLYFSLFNFSLILQILLDLGITNNNNRNIARHSHMLSKYFSNIVSLRLLLAVFYALVSLVAALALGYDIRQFSVLGVLIVNQFLASFVLYLRSNVSGLQFFKTDSILSVLDRFIMILICGILLWGHVTSVPFRIEWFVYSQTAAYLITAIVAFIIVVRKTTYFKLHFDYRFYAVYIKQSFPFALLILLMAFYNRVDSIMIERLLPNGQEESGIYAQAFRILDAFSMIAYLFSVLLMPMFARMLQKKENVGGIIKIAALLLIVPAIVLASVCIVFNNELMHLMYVGFAERSAPVLSYLMVGFIGICGTYIFGSLLTANGSLKYLNIMAAAGMVFNISINFILIPAFWSTGAAFTSMVTQLITMTAQIFIAVKLLNIRANYSLIARIILFFPISIGISFACRYLFHGWFTAFIVAVALSLLFAFLIRIFNLRAIGELIRPHIVAENDHETSE
ncbi:MAG: oligosaccharide flippase family protein [Bacteroidales bacterium]|nr:oligosaccharide flippase family protein [Bacteroidales bacterium]